MASLMAETQVGDRLRLSWTPEALEEAVCAGMLKSEAHYEILNGELYEKIGQNWAHAFAISALSIVFQGLDPTQMYASIQLPLRAGDSMPEPDFVIVRGALRHRHGHPEAGQSLLVIEVSDTSIGVDRNVKGPIYAAGGVPVYWIVDLNRSRVEVRTRPEADTYAETRIFELGDTIPAPFEGAPEVFVDDLIAPSDEGDDKPK